MSDQSTDNRGSHHDLIVIGDGPGSERATALAAAAGCSVAVIGGLPTNVSRSGEECVTLLSEAAQLWRRVERAGEFGVETKLERLDLSELRACQVRRCDNAEIAATRGVVRLSGRVQRWEKNRLWVMRSDGCVVEMDCDFRVFAPQVSEVGLPGLPADRRRVFEIGQLLDLPALPEALTVLGTGPRASALAWALGALGCRVTLLEQAPDLLMDADEDVRRIVVRALEACGVTVVTGAAVASARGSGGETVLDFADGGSTQVTDPLVVALGTRPRWDVHFVTTGPLAVDADGFVAVDERLRVLGAPTSYALGGALRGRVDAASAEAAYVVRDILGLAPAPVEERAIPTVIAIEPEVAYAGLNEAAARAAGRDVVVERVSFLGNGRARIIGSTEGFVKVVADSVPGGTAGSILGIHMVGPVAREQFSQSALALAWAAAPSELADLIQAHPSLSEAYGEALLSLTGRSLHA